ncbi:hypothetical protein N9W17_04555 [Jannaschia sp.]|nr:hypothetical protein [Jannaschia sp.]
MGAIRKLGETPKVAPAPVVALVRLAALECRTGPHHAVEACAILSADADTEDYVVALVRALQGATDRRMVFWRPGETGLSFDEAWLAALLQAAVDNDMASLRFLLGRRLRPGAIPAVRLLVRGLAAKLGSLDS